MKWTKAYKDKLKDSAFLIVSPGGRKIDGRTHPLSLRHLPVRDLKGNLSIKHVRNALSRIPRTGISAAQKKLAREKAEKLLHHSGPFGRPPMRKLRWDAWPKEGRAHEKMVRERKRREAKSNAKAEARDRQYRAKHSPRSLKELAKALELERVLKKCGCSHRRKTKRAR